MSPTHLKKYCDRAIWKILRYDLNTEMSPRVPKYNIGVDNRLTPNRQLSEAMIGLFMDAYMRH